MRADYTSADRPRGRRRAIPSQAPRRGPFCQSCVIRLAPPPPRATGVEWIVGAESRVDGSQAESAMLTIFGGSGKRYCDGQSRRAFLKAGALAMGGAALPGILRAEARSEQAGVKPKRHKSVIMIYLPGGPPHQDTFDIKTEAPSEIRGPYKAIRTNVPGIEIGELLPKMAAMADKLAIVRSVSGLRDEHASFQQQTGYSMSETRRAGGARPNYGSVISSMLGPVHKSVPPFIDLSPVMQHKPYNSPTTGYLHAGHTPFRPEGQGMADMTLNGIDPDRLGARRSLLNQMDGLRREVDASGQMEGMDAFTRQALDVLTSSRMVEALDIEKESPKVRDRYGKGSLKHAGDGGPFYNEHFLMARRLVEAGARCVTVAFGFWDFHGQNFKNCESSLPKLDAAVTSLVQDLHDRGMDKDTTVLVWGDFGRTPKINKDAGRDHWPSVSCALLAGGGMRTGQVIGSTNSMGEVAKDRPVHYQDVLATVYRNMGIDPQATIPDHFGRPMFLLDKGEPMRELY